MTLLFIEFRKNPYFYICFIQSFKTYENASYYLRFAAAAMARGL